MRFNLDRLARLCVIALVCAFVLASVRFSPTALPVSVMLPLPGGIGGPT